MRILLRAHPASFFSPACSVSLTDFLLAGKWTSLFRMVSKGIVVFLFILRKDAAPISSRP